MNEGAHQADMEFCLDLDLEPRVVGNKCGVLYKRGHANKLGDASC